MVFLEAAEAVVGILVIMVANNKAGGNGGRGQIDA
jgi:hypothetical protein